MTHSKVFTDRDGWFVTLVAHPEDVGAEDWLLSTEGGVTHRHYGLFEYALDSNTGMFYIYDPIEAEMYEPIPEMWEGVDTDAVESLYDAINLGISEPIGEEYQAIQRRYLNNVDDPLGALDGGYQVGTIIRHGFDGPASVFIKRDVDLWDEAGSLDEWTDEEVLSEGFEVIWNA